MFINSNLYLEDIKIVSNLPLPWEKIKNKSVLITGASGLIGTFFIDVIMYKNERDNLNVKIFAISRKKEKIEERFKDYLTLDNFTYNELDINKALNINEKVDFIIHAASNTHPKLYASDPIGSLMTNILGTYNLLEYAKNKGVERFIFLSSVEIYGNALKNDDTFDEKYCGYIDSNTFRAAYPEGKRAGEALCNAYIQKYNADVVVPRLSRVYGPTMRLDDSKAMSQFILNGVKNENIVLKSEGNQRYSYCYVADAIAGMLYVMFYGKNGEAYNIADKDTLKLREIAEYIATISNTKLIFDLPKEDEKKGFSKAQIAVMNTDKIQKLGFKNFYNVKTGIKQTVEILKEFIFF